jgi:GTP cyclohydrolase I
MSKDKEGPVFDAGKDAGSYLARALNQHLNGPNLSANANLWENGAATDLPPEFRPTYSTTERKRRIQLATEEILKALGIDYRNDPNTRDTPKRFAKALVDEIFAGKFQKPPKATAFPNSKQFDEMIVVGPMKVKSMCSHHLLPITGSCWIGILPSKKGKVLGLSKYPRIVQWVCARPQIQEEMTSQIAEALKDLTKVNGLAVLVQAKHMCACHRGVNDEQMLMSTSYVHGVFRDDHSVKEEFFSIVKQMQNC